jgi:hypothetical protein
MYDHPGRLVDHQTVVVLVKHDERNRLGEERRLPLDLLLHDNQGARRYRLAGSLHHAPFDRDPSRLDQRLDSGS